MNAVMRANNITQVLKVRIRSVYGRNVVYPANETAQEFCKLVGTKTLTPDTLKAVKRLGYRVEDVTGSKLDEVLS